MQSSKGSAISTSAENTAGKSAISLPGKIRPLLRWAGGKQHLVERLKESVPSDFGSGRYIEPFLGAGSLFLALAPERALLSDANPLLVDFYRRVRDSPVGLSKKLHDIAANNSAETYYAIRDEFNSSRSSIKRAAKFIYLNRTSFNGIYRVNRGGKYNVPYGKKKNPWFPGVEDFQKVSIALSRCSIDSLDYKDALRKAKCGDFVYLDPPYVPVSDTAYFEHYTSERFGSGEQLRLARLVRSLDKRGCKFMMTNSDTLAVRLMYKDFNIRSVSVRRYVTCKTRHEVKELIITNY